MLNDFKFLFINVISAARNDSSPPAGTIFNDKASTSVGALLYLESRKRCLRCSGRNACPISPPIGTKHRKVAFIATFRRFGRL